MGLTEGRSAMKETQYGKKLTKDLSVQLGSIAATRNTSFQIPAPSMSYLLAAVGPIFFQNVPLTGLPIAPTY
jgi:hypothetical protein